MSIEKVKVVDLEKKEDERGYFIELIQHISPMAFSYSCLVF